MRKLWSLLIVLLAAITLSGCTLTDLLQAKAGLQVLTPDIPSSLFLDGQYLEKTPFVRKDLAPKTYQLRIVPDDPKLVPYETSISLTQGTLSVITWKAGPRPETSGGVVYELTKIKKEQTQFSLITIPDRALVSVDDATADFAPILLENMTPGEHHFTVSIPSYEAQEHTVQTIAGYRLNATVKLAQLSNIDTTTPIPSASLSAQLLATNSAVLASQSAQSASGAGTVGTTVLVKSTNFFQDGTEVLRARDEASVEGEEIGLAEVGKTYPYLGEKKDGWYKIMLDGKEAWLSGSYVTLQ